MIIYCYTLSCTWTIIRHIGYIYVYIYIHITNRNTIRKKISMHTVLNASVYCVSLGLHAFKRCLEADVIEGHQ